MKDTKGWKIKMSEKKKVIMLGNEAIARGAYEAGVKVSAAYPGTTILVSCSFWEL